eukprot:11000342-Heterocapsa_arctica.AAC.1
MDQSTMCLQYVRSLGVAMGEVDQHCRPIATSQEGLLTQQLRQDTMFVGIVALRLTWHDVL